MLRRGRVVRKWRSEAEPGVDRLTKARLLVAPRVRFVLRMVTIGFYIPREAGNPAQEGLTHDRTIAISHARRTDDVLNAAS